VRRPSGDLPVVVDGRTPLATAALEEDEAQDLARIFSALGDPARLRMLSIIASADEVCSCELEAPLRRSQPTISHHTKVLAEAGLIESERRGRWTWWHVVPSRLDAVARVLATR
jgi:ArsR family transcriptional regulator